MTWTTGLPARMLDDFLGRQRTTSHDEDGIIGRCLGAQMELDGLETLVAQIASAATTNTPRREIVLEMPGWRAWSRSAILTATS